MREDDLNRDGVRSHQRKRQRADKILNISIGIVILLILLVGGQFLLGNSDQPVVSDKLEDNDQETAQVNNDSNDPNGSNNSNDSTKQEDQKEQPKSPDDSDQQSTADESAEEKKISQDQSQPGSSTNDQGTDDQTPQQGQWEPIGTVQSEPFTAVYDRDHVNWDEMTRAFQYATGLGDDIVLWHVGNGGDHKSAVGVVANYSTRTTPYKVRIEWVTNEGWKPVSVEQLDENIYIEMYNNNG